MWSCTVDRERAIIIKIEKSKYAVHTHVRSWKMNNKSSMQGGQSPYVGSQQSPSTPSPSALCFTSSPKIAENKKRHRHHFHESYHVGLCGCHRMSKSNCVTAIGEYCEYYIFVIFSTSCPPTATATLHQYFYRWILVSLCGVNDYYVDIRCSDTQLNAHRK